MQIIWNVFDGGRAKDVDRVSSANHMERVRFQVDLKVFDR